MYDNYICHTHAWSIIDKIDTDRAQVHSTEGIYIERSDWLAALYAVFCVVNQFWGENGVSFILRSSTVSGSKNSHMPF